MCLFDIEVAVTSYRPFAPVQVLECTKRNSLYSSLCVNRLPNSLPQTGAGWCDSVISTTFVMLWFPNHLPQPPHPPVFQQSEDVEEAPHGMLRAAHGFGYTRLYPRFPRACLHSSFQGQIMSINTVESMKILQILNAGTHKHCFHAFADACCIW